MNYDILEHVKGSSIYVDDMVLPGGALHAAPVGSPSARGEIRITNFDAMARDKDCVRIVTASDIPGLNQIGNIIADEPLLAEGEVDYIGMPVAVVVAVSKAAAWRIAATAEIEIDEKEPITDPRKAYAAGNLIGNERVFSIGDSDAAWSGCDYIISGTVQSGGQEHFYLETQAALAVPQEAGKIKIYSSTQSPATVQKTAALVLGWGMHQIEVDTLRLGGGFGGKEDQATPWAVMAALCASLCAKPVKLSLPREHDMLITGKRHPYTSDYKMGLSKDGKVMSYEVIFYQNSGASADLSTAILERTLFHCCASYFVPNVTARAACCRTNLVPFTAFRGFGGPQGMFVFESALHKASLAMGTDYYELQKKNLLKEGDSFPYGQTAENCHAGLCLEKADQIYDFPAVFKSTAEHNRKNKVIKKGFAVMPVCFGISFTNTMLNQGYAMVHVYHDGSVGVSTGAVEMGQGVNRKIQMITASVFGIDAALVRLESTNTTRAANTSATAASCGTDLNGKAAELAALTVRTHLADFCTRHERNNPLESANGKSGQVDTEDWKKLVFEAYLDRVTLSAHSHYATPDIYFDKVKEKGRPFAYHAYGSAGIETSVNMLNGEYTIDRVMLVHDLGRSVDMAVDIGQIEGGLAQGIGWMTIEEFAFNDKGRILSDNTSNYKVPDTLSSPDDVQITLLEKADNDKAVFGSKAVGEPPLMYGIAAYFSILSACLSRKAGIEFYDAPITPEKIITRLYAEDGNNG